MKSLFFLSFSILSAQIVSAQNHDIRFAVFDVISCDGNPATSDIRERYDWIKNHISNEIIFPVEQLYTESRKDIIAFYREKIQTEEGVVVRSSNGIIYKIKKTFCFNIT